MSQINQLPSATVSQVSSADLLPLYGSNNGSTFKLSLGSLVSWLQSNFARQDYTKNITTPVNGFTLTVAQDGLNRWEIIRPVGALATGTIILPSASVAVDGQEILFNCSYSIAALTVNGNGSSVEGAPTVLASEDTFKLRYELITETWYNVV
jgi:hypothetical protein